MKQFVLTGLFLCLVLPATAQTTRSFSATYDVNATALIHLKNINGQLTLRTADVSTVSVSAVSYFSDPLDEQFLDDIEYVARNSDSKLTFFAKFNTWDHPRDCETNPKTGKRSLPGKENTWWSGWIWTDPENCYPRGPITDLEVIVPRNASLRVNLDQGTLDIDAPGGSLTINADEGTGTIRNIASDLRFQADEGDFNLEFTSIAAIEAETEEGRLGLTFFQPSDFELEIIAGEDADLIFAGRDIDVSWDDDEQVVQYSEGDASNSIALETDEGTLELIFVD